MAKLAIRKVLIKKKVSARQFALRLGIDYRNIWRILREDQNPRLSDLTRYAQALKCRVRDLLEE